MPVERPSLSLRPRPLAPLRKVTSKGAPRDLSFVDADPKLDPDA